MTAFKTPSLKVLALAAVLAPLAAAPALAQPVAAQPGKPGMERRFDPAAMQQRRAEHLRTALQLRSDQEPALQAFLASHKRPDMAARRAEREQLKTMTTPQRLDRKAARMAEAQTRFQQRAAATKTFYAALNPAQQKAFDAMRVGGPRHGKGMGRMRGPAAPRAAG
jgi:periplasmic protein CpxP/Spy